MEDSNIALPDSYASPQALNRVLNQQGYELKKRISPLGFGVQEVRLLDVFFVGPILIYAGTRRELPNALRLTLIALGIATIIYNGHHFILNAEK